MSPRIYGTFVFRLKNQSGAETLYNQEQKLPSERTPITKQAAKVKLKTKTTKTGIICVLPTDEKIKLPKKPFPIRVVCGRIYPTTDGYKIAIVYTIRTKLQPLKPDKIVGIDFGVHKIVTSEPAVYKFPKRLLKILRRRNLKDKTLEQRLRAFYTQVVVTLCKSYDYIAVEKFNPNFQPILGTELFYATLKRQTQKYGKQVVFVDPKNTSKLCATCNTTLEHPKSQSPWCPKCKKTVNRDVNAATNIRNLAQRRSDAAGFAGTLPAPDHPPCDPGQ